MAEGTVTQERRGGVLVLTLNRPDRMNAWSDAMEEGYTALLAQADADPEVKAIVLTGAGRGFCAGYDMNQAPEAPQDENPQPATPFPPTTRKPLIAALNGAAAGVGFSLAMHCDLRFCVPKAKLTTAFARRGLVAEHNLAWLLPRCIGVGPALDLLLSGRIVLGEEAHALGVVDRLVAPETLLDEAVAYAGDLAANCSPWSLATIKRQVREGLSQDADTADAISAEFMLEAERRPDFAEGVASFMERRSPSFPPLEKAD